MRARWLAVGAVVAAGCQAVVGPPAAPPAVDVVANRDREGAGGSDAHPLPHGRGSPELAPPVAVAGLQDVALPKSFTSSLVGEVKSPPDEASPAPDPLTRAAECLDRGDDPAAADHLGEYVRGHPDQLMFRAHLAELLLRLGRADEAKEEFGRFVAAAQETTGPPHDHLVHCHTRLMEIGQRDGDRFAELFHRGVGLLLLAGKLDDADGGEETVCKAMEALTAAKELRPTDPRVHLYLAAAYDRAGNRRAADVSRDAARSLAVPGSLAPGEQFRLAMGAGW